jgi:hypothetical protein
MKAQGNIFFSCNGCHGGGGGGGMCLSHQRNLGYGPDDDTLFRLISLGPMD